MTAYIQIKLFATLAKYLPESGDRFEISPGDTVRDLVRQLNMPEEKARLIFVDGLRADLGSTLEGGERVGIFPPVGGG
jgi:molybdopterin converting factor small subunit